MTNQNQLQTLNFQEMTALNAKQEAIKKAYGEYWETVKDYVDGNGWCSARRSIVFEKIISKLSWQTKVGNQYLLRPSSLQGIENNNGWIRIESESDLPKEGMHHSILLDRECINGYRNYDIIVFYEVNSRYRKKEISHYQPIEEPLKPIY